MLNFSSGCVFNDKGAYYSRCPAASLNMQVFVPLSLHKHFQKEITQAICMNAWGCCKCKYIFFSQWFVCVYMHIFVWISYVGTYCPYMEALNFNHVLIEGIAVILSCEVVTGT